MDLNLIEYILGIIDGEVLIFPTPSGGIAKIMDVAKTDISKVNGVSMSSISKIMGVTP